jgi:hypothetical protein
VSRFDGDEKNEQATAGVNYDASVPEPLIVVGL